MSGVRRSDLLKLGDPIPATRVSTRQGNRRHDGDCRKAYKSAPCSLPHNDLDYITARVAMERLDTVIGPDCWQDRYEDRADGSVRGGIGILVDEVGWVWKWDVGTESDMESDKGSYSDAFKRAAVKWGIARELYPEVARAAAADRGDRPQQPATPHAAPRPVVEPAGEAYASGKVNRGKAPVDMSLRETPDGWAFGFVIEEAVEGKQYPRKTQVLVLGPLAKVMGDHWDNPAEADVWGDLVMVPWQKDGKDMPPFRRIVANRVMTAEWTLPSADAAPPVSVAAAGARAALVENLDDLPF